MIDQISTHKIVDMNDIPHHLLQFKHPELDNITLEDDTGILLYWDLVIGNEKDIRLAALKDELKLWQQRVANDDGVHWYIRDMLKKRIEELEQQGKL